MSCFEELNLMTRHHSGTRPCNPTATSIERSHFITNVESFKGFSPLRHVIHSTCNVIGTKGIDLDHHYVYSAEGEPKNFILALGGRTSFPCVSRLSQRSHCSHLAILSRDGD